MKNPMKAIENGSLVDLLLRQRAALNRMVAILDDIAPKLAPTQCRELIAIWNESKLVINRLIEANSQPEGIEDMQ